MSVDSMTELDALVDAQKAVQAAPPAQPMNRHARRKIEAQARKEAGKARAKHNERH